MNNARIQEGEAVVRGESNLILGGIPVNAFTSFHATFSLLNKPEIRDRIAFWSSFYTKGILLSLSHQKLCVLGF